MWLNSLSGRGEEKNYSSRIRWSAIVGWLAMLAVFPANAQGSSMVPFLGTWRAPDGRLTIQISDDHLQIRSDITINGKRRVDEEALRRGRIEKGGSGLEDVGDGRFAMESRTFTRQQLITEYERELDHSRRDPQNARTEIKYAAGVRAFLRNIPDGPLKSLRLGGVDHCTDRRLIQIGSALVLRVDCKYVYNLVLLQAGGPPSAGIGGLPPAAGSKAVARNPTAFSAVARDQCGSKSTKFVSSEFVPDTWQTLGGIAAIAPKIDLRLACFKHDQCYGNCGAHKASCDEILRINIQNECLTHGGTNRSLCFKLADAYYVAVQKYASSAFNFAQSSCRQAQARPNSGSPKSPSATASGGLSPQQACIDKTNVFSKSLCEARVCQRPEFSNDPYCQELRSRGKSSE